MVANGGLAVLARADKGDGWPIEEQSRDRGRREIEPRELASRLVLVAVRGHAAALGALHCTARPARVQCMPPQCAGRIWIIWIQPMDTDGGLGHRRAAKRHLWREIQKL